MPSTHIPVMPAEVFERLELKAGDVYVDCTAGLGGHAAIAAGLVGSAGRIVLNDVDPGNLTRATERVRAAGVSVDALRGNFADIGRRLVAAGLRADGVLADLGFSSNQMDDGVKGLSFMREAPLDMRLDPSLPISALDLVNGSSEGELSSMIREFGEEPFAGRIARKTCANPHDFADINDVAVGGCGESRGPRRTNERHRSCDQDVSGSANRRE